MAGMIGMQRKRGCVMFVISLCSDGGTAELPPDADVSTLLGFNVTQVVIRFERILFLIEHKQQLRKRLIELSSSACCCILIISLAFHRRYSHALLYVNLKRATFSFRFDFIIFY